MEQKIKNCNCSIDINHFIVFNYIRICCRSW